MFLNLPWLTTNLNPLRIILFIFVYFSWMHLNLSLLWTQVNLLLQQTRIRGSLHLVGILLNWFLDLLFFLYLIAYSPLLTTLTLNPLLTLLVVFVCLSLIYLKLRKLTTNISLHQTLSFDFLSSISRPLLLTLIALLQVIQFVLCLLISSLLLTSTP